MKKLLIIVLSSLLLLSACVPYKPTKFLNKGYILPKKLPNLSVAFDTLKFIEAFGDYRYSNAYLFYNPQEIKPGFVHYIGFEGNNLKIVRLSLESAMLQKMYGSSFSDRHPEFKEVTTGNKKLYVDYNRFVTQDFLKSASSNPLISVGNSGGYQTLTFKSFELFKTFKDFKECITEFRWIDLEYDKLDKLSLSARIIAPKGFHFSDRDWSNVFPDDLEVEVRLKDMSFDELRHDRKKLTSIFIKEDITRHLCSSEGVPKGQIKIELIKVKSTSQQKLLAIPVYFTLALINFLGYPSMNGKVEVEMRAEIYNTSGEKIYSCTGKGKSNKFGAIYWGYSPIGAPKADPPFPQGSLSNNKIIMAATAKAFQEAMNEMKLSIDKNASQISGKLL